MIAPLVGGGVVVLFLNLVFSRPVMRLMDDLRLQPEPDEDSREARELMMRVMDPWGRYAVSCAVGAFFVFEAYDRVFTVEIAILAIIVGLCLAALRVDLFPRRRRVDG